MIDRVGQQLGNYQLVRLLGSGGFAEVYLGEHIHLGTQAAIKVLSAKLNAEEIAHFREEARTIARLKHASIVRVLEFGVESDVPYLVMEHAPHGTLRQRHPKGTRLAPATILPYVQQVAAALQYAHEHKVIHRDVKPENMLIGESGEVLLSDFGIAIVAQSSRYQTTQDVVGTFAYMAPEQIQAHPQPASDQYSLGIVIYEWLCGERPFQGSMSEMLARQIAALPSSLREKIPSLSLEVDAVILTALAKDPKARFASVRAFAAALTQAIQGSAVQPALSDQLPPHSQADQPTTPVQIEAHSRGLTPPLPLSLFGGNLLQPELVQATTNQRTSTPVTPPPTSQKLPARNLSRRQVIAGLAGLAVVGSGAAVLALSQWPHKDGSVQRTPSISAPTSTPVAAVSETVLYIGSWFNHATYALRASDGTVLWQSQGGSHSDEAMAFADGIVYCGSDDHTLYALRASDGTVLWRYQAGGGFATPRAVNGVVYGCSGDDTLYALRANDGSLLWHYQTGAGTYSSPAVVNGVVYIGSEDGSVYAVRATDGSLLWQYPTGGAIYTWVTVDSGVVYSGSGDSYLYALEASDGSLRWRYQTGGAIYSYPTVADGIVYVNAADHHLYAVQVASGNLVRSYQISKQGVAVPAVENGIIYVCSVDANVYAVRASDGSSVWQYQTTGFMGAKPVIINGVLYAGGSSGLYALKVTDGTFLWKFAGPVTAPAIGP